MADHDMDEDAGTARPDAAGELPNTDHDDAPEPTAEPARADRPELADKPPLQEAIDESIGSVAGGPGA